MFSSVRITKSWSWLILMCSKNSALNSFSILLLVEERKIWPHFQVLIVEFVNHFADYTLNGCEEKKVHSESEQIWFRISHNYKGTNGFSSIQLSASPSQTFWFVYWHWSLSNLGTLRKGHRLSYCLYLSTIMLFQKKIHNLQDLLKCSMVICFSLVVAFLL